MTLDNAAEPSPGVCLAVDVGGSKIAVALIASDDTVSHLSSRPTPAADGPEAVLDQITCMLHEITCAAAKEGRCPVAVGVATAGVVDPETGVIVGATDHISGWKGTPLREVLTRRTGLPTHVVNDVHAHALGELAAGIAVGRSEILVVAVGTGIGGALVIDGRLSVGRHGAAGHLGHTPSAAAAGLRCSCGGIGHLEAFASGPGLVNTFRRQGGSARHAQEVTRRAAAGDPVARQCVTDVGAALGQAVGGWINLLDPDAVILTGGLAQAGPAWWAAVTEAADRERIDLLRDCPIVRSSTSSAGALIGAAQLARAVAHPAAGITA